ncbi:unnamed protein product [Sphagnum compactum]
MPGDQELHGSWLKITWTSDNSPIIAARRKPGAKFRTLQQASVWSAPALQDCDTKSAHTSRTRAFGYCEWASPSRARETTQPACVQPRKKGGLEYSPTSSQRAPGREKMSRLWGTTEVGLGELRQI